MKGRRRGQINYLTCMTPFFLKQPVCGAGQLVAHYVETERGHHRAQVAERELNPAAAGAAGREVVRWR